MKRAESTRYKMICTTSYVEDSGLIATYGISCDSGKESTPGQQSPCQIVEDISTESGFIEALVEKLNQFEADPTHLRDLIEDYLP